MKSAAIGCPRPSGCKWFGSTLDIPRIGSKSTLLGNTSKEQALYQFAASDRDGPGWGFGKFACPGRFWAAAQTKLAVMALLLHYDIGYPEGQTDRLEDIMLGEKRTPSRTQQMVLKRIDQ